MQFRKYVIQHVWALKSLHGLQTSVIETKPPWKILSSIKKTQICITSDKFQYNYSLVYCEISRDNDQRKFKGLSNKVQQPSWQLVCMIKWKRMICDHWRCSVIPQNSQPRNVNAPPQINIGGAKDYIKQFHSIIW